MPQHHSTVDRCHNTNDGFATLDAKMKQSLDGLTHIQHLLNNKQATVSTINQDRISRLEQDRRDLQSQLAEKDALLLHNQKGLESERDRCAQLEEKLNTLTRQFQLHQETSRQELDQLQTKNNNLGLEIATLHDQNDKLHVEKNSLQSQVNGLDDMVHELKVMNQSEVQKREQLDLLLRDSAQELKNTTEAALERDQQIEVLQHNVDRLQQRVDEKDRLLKTITSKESDAVNQMQEEINLLEEVNKRLTKELHDAKRKQTQDQQQKQDDTSNLIMSLKQELIACQSQLLEKKSQNQELESAMKRVNAHCDVLRDNLNQVTEESAERYKKMLSFRDEIRVLKQALHGVA
ncbi:hypothetical protein V8B55DRAFT_1377814 [Mucor lusitanicus]|uniref:Uncharacterized protein n=2 Tax=Mucor circinelloides f. lusitanicus TaxID=29924 RepID=A0A168H6B9_MUCCL|nr:hypothetical protein FB192DRAFT_1458315 [Mucor lusitanicus]OAC98420.1 hypothetical protein MUCCIDRAFT_167502 [Mucor lusitanicus CBS 277.49]